MYFFGEDAFLWCVLMPVVRVAVVTAVENTLVQKNVARNAIRDSTLIPQHMALFDFICPCPPS